MAMIPTDALFYAYVLAFSLASSICFISAYMARQVRPLDVRWGLVALLGLSGLWAVADLAFLVVPGAAAKMVIHSVGLTCGFLAVWAWLYFCSAYAGRALHRSRGVWFLALVWIVAVLTIKATNPIHGLYFDIQAVQEPFPHSSIQPEFLFWGISGVSYVLAAGGYVLLFQLLRRVGIGVKPMAAVIALTALPVVLNVIGYATPYLLELNHDALGVAGFAVGVLFLYRQSFQDLSVLGEEDRPAVIVGPERQVLNYNAAALRLFPEIEQRRYDHLHEALPIVAEAIAHRENEIRVPARRHGEQDRDYLITESRFGAGLNQPGALLVFTDVTAREQRRREQSAQLQGLIDSIPGVVFQFRVKPDGSYTIPYVSEAAREMLGVDPDQQDVFQQIVENVPTEEREALMESVREAVRERTPWRKEIPYEVPGGERKWILGTSQPEEREGSVRYNGVLLDVTPQKEAQEQLRRAIQEAESARDEAERANRMKSAFLANMSHEIRTPLTSIIGFAEVIGEEVAAGKSNDVPIAKFAGLIERNGQALMDTLTAVLNLSKMEAGDMDLSTEPVDLVALAQEETDRFQSRAQDGGIDLTLETETTWARADWAGTEIVLRNLLSNAIKYTEAGGSVVVRTRIEAPDEPDGTETAVLEVEDTGIGMDPAQVPDLFRPFRQESEGISREYEGTGLGLTLVQQAVQQMGGAIDVDTAKGRGTCFRVHLPAAEPAPSAGVRKPSGGQSGEERSSGP